MKKFKEYVKKLCQVARLTDEHYMLSLTNLTMWLIMYKVAMTPAVSFQDITALAIAVLGYQAKRVITKGE